MTRSESAEDLELLRRIDAFDRKIADQEAEHARQLAAALEQERNERARERREAEATMLETYRQGVISQAVNARALAPQIAEMIPAGLGSREAIDAAVQLGIEKTAEILAEMTTQQVGGAPVQAPGTTQVDQYLPQGLTQQEQQAAEDGSLSLQQYAGLRQRLGLGHLDNGLFN